MPSSGTRTTYAGPTSSGPRSPVTCRRAATLPPLSPLPGNVPYTPTAPPARPKSSAIPTPSRLSAPPSSATAVPAGDPLALGVQAQPVDQRHRQARARHEPPPFVAVGVGGAERELEPVGAGRPQRQLGVPQPRRRHRLPGVLDGDAQRDVAAEAGRQPEVEGVGAREPPAPDVSPRRAERERAPEAQRIREAQRGVPVDAEAAAAAGHAGQAGPSACGPKIVAPQ